MFQYADRELYCEGVPLREIADDAGTPCFVYSASSIRGAYLDYDCAMRDVPHSICYAVKANATLAVLRLLAELGSGFDVVSGGELYRVLQAGGNPAAVVFSGVGKTAAEIEYALECGIHSFNCESGDELELLDSVAARLDRRARFSLRVNPDVDASTHPYISTGLSEHKFGVEIRRAKEIYRHSRQLENVIATGVSCHIGSQILDAAPVIEAASRVLSLAVELREGGLDLKHVDMGGGLGISYRADHPAPPIRSFVEALGAPLKGSGFRLVVEPGRSIVGPAGVLLTRVLYRKRNGVRDFAIVDAAMNDLIRPALYDAHHDILPLERSDEISVVDVVGPVCETGDFLARERAVAGANPGAYLVVLAAGAYGFAQSSNYNGRLRAAEVLVEGRQWRVVRDREQYADLIRGERV